MDYRSSIRILRAAEDGEGAFVAALRETPDYDAEALAAFVQRHRLLPWLAPVATGAAAERLPPELVAALRETLAEQPARTARLLAHSRRVRDLLSEARIDCLFIKGLPLARRLYGDVNRRHQFDVDVLVRPRDFERAIEVLTAHGWETREARRIRAIVRGRSDSLHAVALRRAGAALDLHWCLRHRALGRVDEEPLWRDRRSCRLDGLELETLSNAHTLGFLVTSIGLDVRRSALRAKLLLDLRRALVRFGPGFDWPEFLEARRREGLLALTVNVLDLFLRIWGEEPEHEAVARALAPHAHLVVVRDADEATELLTRVRNDPANREWFRRVHPPPPGRWTRWLPEGLRSALGALQAGQSRRTRRSGGRSRPEALNRGRGRPASPASGGPG